MNHSFHMSSDFRCNYIIQKVREVDQNKIEMLNCEQLLNDE